MINQLKNDLEKLKKDYAFLLENDSPSKSELQLKKLLIQSFQLCEKAIKEIEQKNDSTQGLWCIDRNPATVTKEWIEENAFRIK
jgi:hypothetical protein